MRWRGHFDLWVAFCFGCLSGAGQSFAVRPWSAASGVDVRYFVTGAFGGYGGFVRDADKDGTYRIPLQIEGKPAVSLKAILYAPGCQFQVLSVDLLSDATRAAMFECRPLSTIAISGAISPPPSSTKPLDVEVDYLAFWGQKVYGTIEGLVDQYELAKAPLNTKGGFQIRIPDFSKDRITTELPSACLNVRVREHVTWNNVEFLSPSADLRCLNGPDLKIQPEYPEVRFEPVPR